MSQAERMNSASNAWEADPWDASDVVAEAQLTGFRERAAKAIEWASMRNTGASVFSIEIEKLLGADVAFFATHDGEELLLMQSVWHGFPDPPEWRLATRANGSDDQWSSWGHFSEMPDNWQLPQSGS